MLLVCCGRGSCGRRLSQREGLTGMGARRHSRPGGPPRSSMACSSSFSRRPSMVGAMFQTVKPRRRAATVNAHPSSRDLVRPSVSGQPVKGGGRRLTRAHSRNPAGVVEVVRSFPARPPRGHRIQNRSGRAASSICSDELGDLAARCGVAASPPSLIGHVRVRFLRPPGPVVQTL